MLGVKGGGYLETQTSMGIFKDPYNCKNIEYFLRLALYEGKTIAIPANRLVTLRVIHNPGMDYTFTNFIMSFIARPNNYYFVGTSDYSDDMGGETELSLYLRKEKIINGKVQYQFLKWPFLKRKYKITYNLWGLKGDCEDKIASDYDKNGLDILLGNKK